MSEQQVSVEDFEAEVKAFLEANTTRKKQSDDRGFTWGEGDDSVAMFEEVDPEEERRGLAESKAWRAKRFHAGLGWITGPEEYGGRGLTVAPERAYARRQAPNETPAQGVFCLGPGMGAPTTPRQAGPRGGNGGGRTDRS